MFRCVVLSLVLLLPTGFAHADTARWCDDTIDLAAADGSIGINEYPGGVDGVGDGFGGVIGTGRDMFWDTDDAGNLAFAMAGPGGCNPLVDAVVVYIDSVPGVGITNTSVLTDTSDLGRAAASGSAASGSSDLEFATGFAADFAVVIESSGANLFELVEGGSHIFVASLTTAPSGGGFGDSCTKEMNGISMADLESQPGNPFRWVATVLNPTNAFRSNEFNGAASTPAANIGANPHQLPDGSFNVFTSYAADAAFRGDAFYFTDFEQFESGIAATPSCSQLNSMSWAISGFSDGEVAFGGTNVSGDYARGVSTGGETMGGLYAFEPVANDPSLGVNPTAEDFSPGTFTMRTRNATLEEVRAVEAHIVSLVLNNEDRASRYTLEASTDGTNFTPIPSYQIDTPEGADATPGWVATPSTVSISGLAVPPDGYFYLRWTGDDLSGAGARDEFAIGSIVLTPTYPTCGDGVVDDGEACDNGALGTDTCGCQLGCQLAADGTACGDGVACNGDEVCASGACDPGTAVDCDDNDACTADSCTEPGGTCENTPIVGCCNVDAECDDSNGETTDACVDNACVNTPIGADADAGSGDAEGSEVDAGSSDAGGPDADASSEDTSGPVDAGTEDTEGSDADAVSVDAQEPVDAVSSDSAEPVDAGSGDTDGPDADVTTEDTGGPDLDAAPEDTGGPDLDAATEDTGGPDLDAGAQDTGSDLDATIGNDSGTDTGGSGDSGPNVDAGIGGDVGTAGGTTDDEGCSTTSGPSSGGPPLWVLAGFAFLFWRRRTPG